MKAVIPRRPRTALPLAALAAVGLGCADPGHKGELMMVVETDMSLPKDVDRVRVEVLAFGAPKFDQQFEKLGNEESLKIPASLGVLVSDEEPSTPVTFRVTAWQGAKPRVLRQAITTIPEERLAMMRLPVQWLCWNQVDEDASTGSVSSSCGEGQTCLNGACVDDGIDSSALPDYDPEKVFGGGTGKGDGSCFDVGGCFAGSTTAEIDLATCTIPAGADVNVAIQVESAGICGPTGCFIPLSANSEFGWKVAEADAGRLALPIEVCTRIKDAKALGVAVAATSDACPQKTDALPTCGPWSSAGSAPPSSAPSALAAGQDHPNALALDGQSLYWINAGSADGATGTVKRIPLGGGAITVLAAGQANPQSLAVDTKGNVYWTNGATGQSDGAVLTTKAGATMPTVLAPGLDAPAGIALGGGALYYTTFKPASSVYELLLQGGATPSALGDATQNHPYRVAVDAKNAYWTNAGSAGAGGAVMWASLASKGPQPLAGEVGGAPHNLALDRDAGGDAVALYWTSFEAMGAVMVATVSGGTPGAPSTFAANQARPNGVAVDGTWVYWTNRDAGAVLRMKKSEPGGAPEEIAKDQHAPGAIVVDANSIYWINEGSSSAADGAVMRMSKPQ